jgi:hypothetical protein
MSDLKAYREQVAELGKLANQAEAEKQWEAAVGYYMSALDIFIHLIKCKFKLKLTSVVEKNPSLTKIYKDRMQQYLTRAEYIKKTALNKPDPEPTEGGTA